ncbi:Qat anti-phage system ATPase QatA [Devosia sp.]|uniref:Qat anti-phage system ATPase QatA n=1 Tax=Devosia sp. TaxID=1871048 RepID=UPI00292E3B87|nr:Qat anti-phage system ATPase QatA [Devosia sp.]
MGQSDGAISFGYIADRETRLDLLRNEAIAKTVVELISLPSEHSLTVGVHGDWGAGKSSVLEMVEAAFSDDGSDLNGKDFLCIRFNGWEFQGFEDAKIALIEGVVSQLIEKRPALKKAEALVKRVFDRIDWLKVAKRAGGLAFNVVTGLPSPDQIGSLLSTLQAKASDPQTFLNPENAKAALAEVQAVLTEAGDHTSVPNEMREFHKAFGDLVDAAGIKRLVVLVDDLDRCLPETAIQTLEAIRLFVSLPKTAFVIGADEAMIEYSVQRHFQDLPEGEKYAGYPRAYLEKLIQVPFRIPAMGDTETRIYMTMLLLGTIVGEGSSEFTSLLGHAQARMSKPWDRQGLDEEEIKKALGAKYNADTARAVALADQISPILASGTKGNPRQVKRFVNALNLRLKISQARGFGDAIKPDVLAKVMLAEFFLPISIFEHIALSAANATDGKCDELALIERHVRTDLADDKAGDQPSEPNLLVEEWKSRGEVTRWAAIDPVLSEGSLKPYLFVINDRKSFVGAGLPLSSKLLALIERLTGGEYSASSTISGLAQMEASEIEIVFGAMKARLLAEPNLKAKPASFIGISALSAARPEYQSRYIEVLELLQADRLGSWAASGHQKIVTSPEAKARLTKLREKWRLLGSGPLKVALSAIGEE